MADTARWTRRPDGANWGDFGPDDQLGRVNFIGSEQVLKGAAEVKAGRSFCLSLPLDLPGGNALNARRNPPRLQPTWRGDTPVLNYGMDGLVPDSIDVVSRRPGAAVPAVLDRNGMRWRMSAPVSTSTADGSEAMVYYNGYRAQQDVKGPHDMADGCCDGGHQSHADALGIENMAVHGMQGRGVLVDLARHFGRERKLIGYDEMAAVMAQDGVMVERGDFLVLRTGFAELRAGDGRQARPEGAASHLPGAQWPRPAPAAVDYRQRHCRHLRRQLRGRGLPGAGRGGPQVHPAAAPSLPVQAGHSAGRDCGTCRSWQPGCSKTAAAASC